MSEPPLDGVMESVAVVAADYRSRMRLPDDEPLALLMPAWANPKHMTDEEFRATFGAREARRLGFTCVTWGDRDGVSTRTITL